MRFRENVDPSLDRDNRLGYCQDYKEEKTALDFLVEKSGHRLFVSPNFHHNYAGVEWDIRAGRVRWSTRSKDIILCSSRT